MAARLAQYGFSIPAEKTLYEYINPRVYSWTNPSTTQVQLMWNSVAQEMTAVYLNEAYYNVLKDYYSNIEMTDNSNYLNSSAFPRVGNLHPYGTGVVVGTHQDTANYSNITFSTFRNATNSVRATALAAPQVPFRTWLSHWSYNIASPNNYVFNLDYAKYWTENVFHTLLSGSDGIIWWNSGGADVGDPERTTADRTAESTAMNTMLQEFDSLTYFRQDRTTLVSNLISTSANYILTGMRVPNYYNLYRFTPNHDSGNTFQVLQENPAIFLVNNTTRVMIPGGEIYTPANNVAPYGYWIIQPLSGGNPIVETGTCVNTCVNEIPDSDPDVECTNDCISGQTKCSDTTHRQTCGQHDSDTCLEWSSATACSGSTACGYGTCSATQKPSWSCKDGKCVYVCVNSTVCKSTQAYIKDYKKACYNDDIYWYDSTGQIQSIYENCQDSCANASCVSSETAAAVATEEANSSENANPPAPEIVKTEKEQPFLDSIIQFITSHILLTIITVVSAYLVFAVAGYMLFKRMAG
jgi:hypothetical protein